MLSWYTPSCLSDHADRFGTDKESIRYGDIFILDESTGIVYQGHMYEGTGYLQEEVEEFLETA